MFVTNYCQLLGYTLALSMLFCMNVAAGKVVHTTNTHALCMPYTTYRNSVLYALNYQQHHRSVSRRAARCFGTPYPKPPPLYGARAIGRTSLVSR